MTPYILGIDIGTGSTKAVAITLTGETQAISQFHYKTYSPEQGLSEQEPKEILEAFIKCVNQITSSLGEPLAIGFSSAMHSLIAVDQLGEPLLPMMTWADARSERIASRVKESEIAEKLYNTTGTPIHPMSPIFKIIWIKEQQPEIFEKTAKFISIKEYIWHFLFDRYEIDYSIASATGMFDIEELAWYDEALNLAGITKEHLSNPVNTGHKLQGLSTYANTQLDLSSKVSFVIGASDGCLANLGSYAFTPETATLTIGTSGAVRITSNHAIKKFPEMVFNYRLDSEIFVCGGAINNGGNVLGWLLKNFLNKDDITSDDYTNIFEETSSIAAGSEGLLFLPYLHGERAPIWDIKSSGSFLGIKSKHTQKHFSKAVLEGVCFALNDVLSMVEGSSRKITRLHVSGGIVLSDIWLQMLADVTNKDVCVLQTEDASAIGAAFLSMKSLGVISSYTDLPSVKSVKTLSPSKNHLVYQQCFLIYKQLYNSLKDSMHLLHNLNTNH